MAASAVQQYQLLGPYSRQGTYEKSFAGGAMSPELTSPTITNVVGAHEKPTTTTMATTTATTATSTTSRTESPQLSPVFKSEAAKQIIKEMTEKRVEGPRRRQIPREKRRHYTVSSSKPVLDLEDTFSKMVLFWVFFQFSLLLFSLSLFVSHHLFPHLRVHFRFIYVSVLSLIVSLYLPFISFSLSVLRRGSFEKKTVSGFM